MCIVHLLIHVYLNNTIIHVCVDTVNCSLLVSLSLSPYFTMKLESLPPVPPSSPPSQENTPPEFMRLCQQWGAIMSGRG